jgi:tRNA uridine 5-carboxymethylaminomethyl modification enzyme
VNDERWRVFCSRQNRVRSALDHLWGTAANPSRATQERLQDLGSTPLGRPVVLGDLLRRNELKYEDMAGFSAGTPALDAEDRSTVEVEVKYAGYLGRQQEQVDRSLAMEDNLIPEEIRYVDLNGISRESSEKLSRVRPRTVGQASRIPGVTPADISILLVHLERGRRLDTSRSA